MCKFMYHLREAFFSVPTRSMHLIEFITTTISIRVLRFVMCSWGSVLVSKGVNDSGFKTSKTEASNI